MSHASGSGFEVFDIFPIGALPVMLYMYLVAPQEGIRGATEVYVGTIIGP